MAGEDLTGSVRAAFAGDTTSPLTNWGSAGLQHINADYTVALSREPVGGGALGGRVESRRTLPVVMGWFGVDGATARTSC